MPLADTQPYDPQRCPFTPSLIRVDQPGATGAFDGAFSSDELNRTAYVIVWMLQEMKRGFGQLFTDADLHAFRKRHPEDITASDVEGVWAFLDNGLILSPANGYLVTIQFVEACHKAASAPVAPSTSKRKRSLRLPLRRR